MKIANFLITYLRSLDANNSKLAAKLSDTKSGGFLMTVAIMALLAVAIWLTCGATADFNGFSYWPK